MRNINSPKRKAFFTVLQEEGEDGIPIHKGQKIIPKSLTDNRMHIVVNMSYPYEVFVYGKDELKKYPIVEIR